MARPSVHCFQLPPLAQEGLPNMVWKQRLWSGKCWKHKPCRGGGGELSWALTKHRNTEVVTANTPRIVGDLQDVEAAVLLLGVLDEKS